MAENEPYIWRFALGSCKCIGSGLHVISASDQHVSKRLDPKCIFLNVYAFELIKYALPTSVDGAFQP